MKTSLIKKQYPDNKEVKYLGRHNDRYCFGITMKNEMETVDRPFYILANDDNEIEEIGMFMFADDSYETSQFATIERKFKYFETNDLFV